MPKVTPPTSRFWFQKLQEQIAIVNRKRKSEPLDRIFALDMALAYLFLYLFLEATIDQIVWNISNSREDFEAVQQYRKRSRHLRDKLEFLFTRFCAQLPFERFATLKQEIQPLVEIRNRVVHLEELSWSISLKEDQRFEEKPTGITKYLTVRSLQQHYDEVRDFLINLAVTLNGAFENATIGIVYKEGDQSEAKTHNLIEFIYQISVPPLKNFDGIT